MPTAEVDYTYTTRGMKQSVTNPYLPGTPNPTDGITTFGYDAAGRLATVNKPDGSSVSTRSDNGKTSYDERGNSSLRSYDGLGRLSSVEEPDGFQTNYIYDLLNNIIEIDQMGSSPDVQDWHVSRFQYDSLSRLVGQSSPEAGGKAIYYNDSNAPYGLCSYDPSNVCGTQDDYADYTTMTYDVLGRLTSVYTPEQDTLTYGYDAITMLDGTPATNAIGRMVKMQRNDTMREMSYDSMGRPTKVLDVLPSDAFASPQKYSTILATYDTTGSQTSLTYPSGRVVNYNYSLTTEQLKSVTLASVGGQPVNTTYVGMDHRAPNGALTSQVFGNGVAQTTTYNNRMQPVHTTFAKGSNTLYDKTTTWTDANGKNSGLIWGVQDGVDPSQSATYSYDAENRLTGAMTPNWSQTYTYDAFGNQTQSGSWTYLSNFDLGNHPGSQSVDSLGFIHTAPDMIFSADGLIQGIGADNEVTFTYDAANMRSRVDSFGTWRESLYLGTTLLATRNSQNTGWTDYIYANGARVAVADSAGNTRYHITDQVGSMVSSSDSAGNYLGGTQLTPFGRTVSDNTGVNLLFSGKERDTESGLDYFGAMYYASSMGRFMSADPSGLVYADPTNPQTLNLYSYAVNNPLRYLDPTGLTICNWVHSDTGAGAADGNDYDDDEDCVADGGRLVQSSDSVTARADGSGNSEQDMINADVTTMIMYQTWPGNPPPAIDPDTARITALVQGVAQQTAWFPAVCSVGVTGQVGIGGVAAGGSYDSNSGGKGFGSVRPMPGDIAKQISPFSGSVKGDSSGHYSGSVTVRDPDTRLGVGVSVNDQGTPTVTASWAPGPVTVGATAKLGTIGNPICRPHP